MSEYIEIETETTDDPDVMRLITNLRLTTDGDETYEGPSALEEGSPLAQALAFVEGITSLTLTSSDILVTREPDTPWHLIVADISAAIKDFFL